MRASGADERQAVSYAIRLWFRHCAGGHAVNDVAAKFALHPSHQIHASTNQSDQLQSHLERFSVTCNRSGADWCAGWARRANPTAEAHLKGRAARAESTRKPRGPRTRESYERSGVVDDDRCGRPAAGHSTNERDVCRMLGQCRRVRSATSVKERPVPSAVLPVTTLRARHCGAQRLSCACTGCCGQQCKLAPARHRSAPVPRRALHRQSGAACYAGASRSRLQ